MADNLLESYNPLYDVHLRQYFALPHMQKHLRDVGLIEASKENQKNSSNIEVYKHHQVMMEMLLRNRERVLSQLADLHKKIDAAEKVEIIRKIRSGLTNTERELRAHASRSLSRPARSRAKRSSTGDRRQRRHSNSFDDSEVIKRVEADYESNARIKNPKDIYSRLTANVYKYQYLHKLDDRTLHKYKQSLKKQISKLERFRELTFGSHSVARHQPSSMQSSWFFRRRSLPSLTKPSVSPNKTHQPLRSLKSLRNRKSSSPRKGSSSEAPPKTRQTMSRVRASGQHRLPPLPTTNAKKNTTKLPPPTATVKPTFKEKLNVSDLKSIASTPKKLEKTNLLPEINGAVDHLNGEIDKHSNAHSHSPISSTTHEDFDSIQDRGFDSERGYSSTGDSTYADSLSETGGGTTETRPTPEPFLENQVNIDEYLNSMNGSTKTLNQSTDLEDQNHVINKRNADFEDPIEATTLNNFALEGNYNSDYNEPAVTANYEESTNVSLNNDDKSAFNNDDDNLLIKKEYQTEEINSNIFKNVLEKTDQDSNVESHKEVYLAETTPRKANISTEVIENLTNNVDYQNEENLESHHYNENDYPKNAEPILTETYNLEQYENSKIEDEQEHEPAQVHKNSFISHESQIKPYEEEEHSIKTQNNVEEIKLQEPNVEIDCVEQNIKDTPSPQYNESDSGINYGHNYHEEPASQKTFPTNVMSSNELSENNHFDEKKILKSQYNDNISHSEIIDHNSNETYLNEQNQLGTEVAENTDNTFEKKYESQDQLHYNEQLNKTPQNNELNNEKTVKEKSILDRSDILSAFSEHEHDIISSNNYENYDEANKVNLNKHNNDDYSNEERDLDYEKNQALESKSYQSSANEVADLKSNFCCEKEKHLEIEDNQNQLTKNENESNEIPAHDEEVQSDRQNYFSQYTEHKVEGFQHENNHLLDEKTSKNDVKENAQHDSHAVNNEFFYKEKDHLSANNVTNNFSETTSTNYLNNTEHNNIVQTFKTSHEHIPGVNESKNYNNSVDNKPLEYEHQYQNDQHDHFNQSPKQIDLEHMEQIANKIAHEITNNIVNTDYVKDNESDDNQIGFNNDFTTSIYEKRLNFQNYLHINEEKEHLAQNSALEKISEPNKDKTLENVEDFSGNHENNESLTEEHFNDTITHSKDYSNGVYKDEITYQNPEHLLNITNNEVENQDSNQVLPCANNHYFDDLKKESDDDNSIKNDSIHLSAQSEKNSSFTPQNSFDEWEKHIDGHITNDFININKSIEDINHNFLDEIQLQNKVKELNASGECDLYSGEEFKVSEEAVKLDLNGNDKHEFISENDKITEKIYYNRNDDHNINEKTIENSKHNYYNEEKKIEKNDYNVRIDNINDHISTHYEQDNNNENDVHDKISNIFEPHCDKEGKKFEVNKELDNADYDYNILECKKETTTKPLVDQQKYDFSLDEQSSQTEDANKLPENFQRNAYEGVSHTSDPFELPTYSETNTEQTRKSYVEELKTSYFLSHPLIEITPASDYYNSNEDHLEKILESQSTEVLAESFKDMDLASENNDLTGINDTTTFQSNDQVQNNNDIISPGFHNNHQDIFNAPADIAENQKSNGEIDLNEDSDLFLNKSLNGKEDFKSDIKDINYHNVDHYDQHIEPNVQKHNSEIDPNASENEDEDEDDNKSTDSVIIYNQKETSNIESKTINSDTDPNYNEINSHHA